MKMYLIVENKYRMPDKQLYPYGIPELYNKRIYTIRGAKIALGRAKSQYRKIGKPARNLQLIEESFWPDEWYYSDWAYDQAKKIA